MKAATYEIRENNQYNSREVYFTGKPAAETRTALKSLKMRWNPKKMCWYGFAEESEIIDAIQRAEPATVLTDGYMGGGAIYGSKSNKNLYGADLSAAIRADIKAAGIKGATVKVKSASLTENIYITVKISDKDITPAPTTDPNRHYICEFERTLIYYSTYYIDGEPITIDNFNKMTEQEKEVTALKYQVYIRECLKSCDIYHNTSKIEGLCTPDFIKKIEQIIDIVRAYHYDGSNSMVDYFDTNFYWQIRLKEVA